MTRFKDSVTGDSLWYKDAIIYQLHVRSFYDSNGDGIGDFRGLIEKLDYVQRLGVNTLWLMPFYPSPLKDGGYDISDFTNIHPDYGTLADFRRFVREAHQRGLRVITELVLNHTSTEHKWFQRARKARPGSAARDYYVWSDTPDKYQDARIIFQDFEVSNWTYDHEAKAYYWHRFYSHQPDLNFENPRVQAEVLKVLDFWIEIGVDGFRLDAVPYLFEAEGTNCENLPETHAFLKKLRNYVDDHYPGIMLLAEANQWPNDARDYFGDGDECHMAFHFPLMPRLYMALRMEDRFPVVDIMEQTPKIPENSQWAIFLRNHDELTLEMVSDEERDYMYKSFAQDPRKRVNVGIRRRLFPLLGGDFRSIEMLNFLLFSMPGTPIVYYGDEIGMGDNYYLGDRDGMRTPMQWSPDKNAGFSGADPQRLYLPVVIDTNYHFSTVNVENQERNPSSFLWWKRRVINKRKQYKAFGRGSIRFVNTNNPKVLAFVREYEEETILVVVNLSRYSQSVELDLHEYAGSIPMEVFSRNDFPLITDEPWKFSMQFKNYFWFELPKPGKEITAPETSMQVIEITTSQWKEMEAPLRGFIKQRIYEHIIRSKWFKGNVRKLRDIKIVDVIALQEKPMTPYFFIVLLDLIEGDKDFFVMTVSLAINTFASEIKARFPEAVIASVVVDEEQGILYDGVYDPHAQEALFGLIRKRAKLKGIHGELEGSSGSRLRKLQEKDLPLKSQVVACKRSNISVTLGDKYFFKFYRSPQEGENPDVELLKNLTRHTSFEQIPPYVGRLDYRSPGMADTTIGLLEDLIPNVGNAWEMTETAIEQFFDKVISEKDDLSKGSVVPDEILQDFMGPFFLEMVKLLGIRTAHLHQAFASLKDTKGFELEPFSLLYQKSLYQSLRTFVKRTFSLVNNQMGELSEKTRELIGEVLQDQDLYLEHMRGILEQGKMDTLKTRIHGNFKLDKLLFTGKDFIFTDFEGEVEFPLSVRKIKQSPMKDVATILTSFHYIIYDGYFFRKEFVPVDENFLRPLVERWYEKVKVTFISAYAGEARQSGLIPGDDKKMHHLLDLFLFEKAVREIQNFVKNDPRLLIIPVKALQRLKALIIQGGS